MSYKIDTKLFIESFTPDIQREFGTLYYWALYHCGGDFSMFDNLKLLDEHIKQSESSISKLLNKDINIIGGILTEASEYNLETEVVTWALKEMKENPKLELWEAMNLGANEWLK